jgi:hypothetical protein
LNSPPLNFSQLLLFSDIQVLAQRDPRLNTHKYQAEGTTIALEKWILLQNHYLSSTQSLLNKYKAYRSPSFYLTPSTILSGSNLNSDGLLVSNEKNLYGLFTWHLEDAFGVHNNMKSHTGTVAILAAGINQATPTK